MNAEVPASGRDAGLRAAVGRLAESGVAFLRTRADLAALEFSEGRDRARDRLVVAAIAGVALTFAWAGVCVLVVAAFWDSHRIGALCGVVAFHVVVGGFALWRLRADQAAGPPPFAQTLAELDRDRQWVAEHFRSER